MREYLLFSITGINMIVTITLAFTVLYWFLVIIGFISQDLLDFDFGIDGDVDGDLELGDNEQSDIETNGFLKKFLEFAHLDTVPFMVYMTIYTLVLWILTMLTYYFPFSPKSFMAFVLLIIDMNASLIVTKGITKPLLPFFQGLEENTSYNPIGKRAVMQTNLNPNRLGQALISRGKGSEILLNVVSHEDLCKNDYVKIVEKLDDRDVYLVEKLYQKED